MHKISFKNSEFHKAYGILCSCASVPKETQRPGVFPTFCKIPGMGNSIRHRHFESEIFFIIQGHGQMRIENESVDVSAGDLIQIPSGHFHELINTDFEELQFLSVYSENRDAPSFAPQYNITSAPPTPNGPLHLGHMSGPYLSADILTRYLRQKGSQVSLISGTDDHQNYVAFQAQKLNQAPQTFRSSMRTRIINGFKSLNIHHDEFTEPKMESDYKAQVQSFFQRAIDKSIIQKEQILFPHCETCANFLVDAAIIGNCPDCQNPSHGSCENCGVVVMPNELHNIRCAICPGSDKIPKLKKASVYTFHLGRNLPLIVSDLNKLETSSKIKNLIQKMLHRKNAKVLVSHPDPENHGIAIPSSQQSIHVWFEMAATYEKFAISPKKWISCFGFDNSFYYLLFIPSVLKAVNQESRFPDHVITNDFLNLEGSKFSTSRNHALWADDFLADASAKADTLRFFLALHRPSTKTSDFSKLEFYRFAKDLEGTTDRLIFRAKSLSKVPTDSEIESDECKRLLRDLELCLGPVNFNPRQATRKILTLIDLILEFQGSSKTELKMLETLSEALIPIMPDFSRELLLALRSNERQQHESNRI